MEGQRLHSVLIILHATSAAISFLAGCLLIFTHTHISNQRLSSVYLWTLIGMVVLLAAAILSNWVNYSGVERIVFPSLFILGIYMIYRARSANHLLRTQQNDWKQGYIKDIGFTLISLFEGFIIVGGIDLNISGWVIVLLAILGVLAGNWVIGLAQRRAA